MIYDHRIVELTADTLVRAGSIFSQEKKDIYLRAVDAQTKQTNERAKWALETILENALVAEKNRSPLCDDTGIPHVVLDVGPNALLTGATMESIREGIRVGLRRLPGRPMAVRGDDYSRIGQSEGLFEDPAALDMAPFHVRTTPEDVLRLHVLLFGGGPAIRGKTYRVFHKHNTDVVLEEIIEWAKESTALLGCTPCTLGVGIGRSHYEAASLMLEALVDGSYEKQSDMEEKITRGVNESGTGPIGLGGSCTVLATFLKVGPQRSSGVRIVSLRPCCCFEPRIASVDL